MADCRFENSCQEEVVCVREEEEEERERWRLKKQKKEKEIACAI
jgi:hypothetical protein